MSSDREVTFKRRVVRSTPIAGPQGRAPRAPRLGRSRRDIDSESHVSAAEGSETEALSESDVSDTRRPRRSRRRAVRRPGRRVPFEPVNAAVNQAEDNENGRESEQCMLREEPETRDSDFGGNQVTVVAAEVHAADERAPNDRAPGSPPSGSRQDMQLVMETRNRNTRAACVSSCVNDFSDRRWSKGQGREDDRSVKTTVRTQERCGNREGREDADSTDGAGRLASPPGHRQVPIAEIDRAKAGHLPGFDGRISGRVLREVNEHASTEAMAGHPLPGPQQRSISQLSLFRNAIPQRCW
jgi:hypothetical protein